MKRFGLECGMRLPVLLALAVLGPSALAEVRLPSFFADHMVVQRDRPLEVWGWASPGEKVSVSFGGKTATGTANATGEWRLGLGIHPMSKTPRSMTVKGKNAIEVRDILVGDVWLCSGQSNMEWGLGGCDAPEDIRTADFPEIRHFGVEYHFASRPQTDLKGRWAVCTPQTAPGFSAVAFYFARKVQAETGVPIGLMRSSVGGTNIELWMSQETLLGTPSLKPFADRMRESLTQYQADLAAVLPKIDAWSAQAKAAKKAGATIPLPPDVPPFPFGEQGSRPRCVTLHNGMIAPLKGLKFRGVLWYQGENNAGSAFDGAQYIEKKKAMVADWRQWFGDPKLPFYYVQLAAWQAPNPDPAGGDGWAIFRDAQRRALEIPYTGMASAVDLGDAQDIHPKDKRNVGERLALWALKNEYGKSAVHVSGPLFRRLTVSGNEARIEFDHLGGGLIVGAKGEKNAIRPSDGKLAGFAIAGADRKWHWADAKIVGETVVCTSPDVPNPVAVRYAFRMNPEGANLYNRALLPASPFRTDDW